MKTLLLACALLSSCAYGTQNTPDAQDLKNQLLDESIKFYDCIQSCTAYHLVKDLLPLIAETELRQRVESVVAAQKITCSAKKAIIKNMLEIQKKLKEMGVSEEEITQLSIGPTLILFPEKDENTEHAQ
ncbi:hypothetical protein Noda2021_00530 [Candidatus Dependentiae bacterium Noda2021]|nr:hypothetical protein Noda2021_00530 [Candidatus Dependentiae bacterium Noda2021]